MDRMRIKSARFQCSIDFVFIHGWTRVNPIYLPYANQDQTAIPEIGPAPHTLSVHLPKSRWAWGIMWMVLIWKERFDHVVSLFKSRIKKYTLYIRFSTLESTLTGHRGRNIEEPIMRDFSTRSMGQYAFYKMSSDWSNSWAHLDF